MYVRLKGYSSFLSLALPGLENRSVVPWIVRGEDRLNRNLYLVTPEVLMINGMNPGSSQGRPRAISPYVMQG